jgi:hypothetical protein
MSARAIVDRLNRQLGKDARSRGVRLDAAVRFWPRQQGGFSFWLQDRSGGQSSSWTLSCRNFSRRLRRSRAHRRDDVHGQRPHSTLTSIEKGARQG